MATSCLREAFLDKFALFDLAMILYVLVSDVVSTLNARLCLILDNNFGCSETNRNLDVEVGWPIGASHIHNDHISAHIAWESSCRERCITTSCTEIESEGESAVSLNIRHSVLRT